MGKVKCHFHLTGILTKVKFLKIIGCLPFLAGIGQKFGPCGISAIFALNFHSCVCITSTFSFKRYIPHVKYEKNLCIDNARSLTFFTTLDLIWPKFYPKTTPTMFLFAGFQWNMWADSINILITSLTKKLVRFYCYIVVL